MGRCDPKHSDAQREAVIANQLDRGESAAATVRAAAAGELGLPAFTIGETTCRTYAREAKRDGRPDVRDAPPLTADDRVRSIAEKTIARVEALDAPASKDLHALRQAQQIVHAADRQAPRPDKPAEDTTPEFSPLTEQLLARLNERDKARAEGRPCTCDRPVPRSWDHDENGNPICHGCELAVGKDWMAAEQERKDEWRREAERAEPKRIGTDSDSEAPPSTTHSEDTHAQGENPRNGNGTPGRQALREEKQRKRDMQDPRNWGLLH
jgi:hypothetical protein